MANEKVVREDLRSSWHQVVAQRHVHERDLVNVQSKIRMFKQRQRRIEAEIEASYDRQSAAGEDGWTDANLSGWAVTVLIGIALAVYVISNTVFA